MNFPKFVVFSFLYCYLSHCKQNSAYSDREITVPLFTYNMDLYIQIVCRGILIAHTHPHGKQAERYGDFSATLHDLPISNTAHFRNSFWLEGRLISSADPEGRNEVQFTLQTNVNIYNIKSFVWDSRVLPRLTAIFALLGCCACHRCFGAAYRPHLQWSLAITNRTRGTQNVCTKLELCYGLYGSGFEYRQ